MPYLWFINAEFHLAFFHQYCEADLLPLHVFIVNFHFHPEQSCLGWWARSVLSPDMECIYINKHVDVAQLKHRQTLPWKPPSKHSGIDHFFLFIVTLLLPRYVHWNLTYLTAGSLTGFAEGLCWLHLKNPVRLCQPVLLCLWALWIPQRTKWISLPVTEDVWIIPT